jgi:hypothetical protein
MLARGAFTAFLPSARIGNAGGATMRNIRARVVGISLLSMGLLFTACPWGCPSPSVECEPLVDANGDTPTSTLGAPLCRSYTTASGNVEIFFNTRNVDASEGVSEAQAQFAGDCVECAWLLLMSPPEGTFAFASPLGSNFLSRPDNVENLPVWVTASCDPYSLWRTDPRIACGEPGAGLFLGALNGGSERPRVHISPLGALFGCSGCDPAYAPPHGYDSVALHELAHVLFKSYNAFLNSGPVGFLNEGLPSGLLEVPLCPFYAPGNPVLFLGKRLNGHLNLSYTSLRNHSYSGSPFWYFLAKRYTSIADSDSRYDEMSPPVAVPAVCEAYARAVGPFMQTRRLPGRDMILHIQEDFRQCHPRGLDTPQVEALEVRAADPDDPEGDPGCVPAGYPGWGSHWRGPLETEDDTDGSQRVGEVLMPFVLGRIDKVLTEQHGMVPDGMAFQAFREYLVWNYLTDQKEEYWSSPDYPDDPEPEAAEYPYRLPSFSAHYFEFPCDASLPEWSVQLTKGYNMGDWAYGVFYMDGYTPMLWDEWGTWHTADREDFRIPNRYDKAVLIVASFQTNWRAGGLARYVNTGGHYAMTRSR